jgi:hypothetical protein
MHYLGRVKILSVCLSLLLLGCTSSSVTSSEPSAMPEAAPSPVAQSAIESRQTLPLSAQFETAGQMIQLEVAETPQQQAIGLMFRDSLADDRGMLFAFEAPRPRQFWMRNTLIPLDMVFLLNGEIKAIVADVPPCTTQTCPTYGTEIPVNQVIELRGGRAAELELEVGQRLNIEPIPQAN